MRARDRSKDRNKHHKRGPRRQRIAKKLQGHITGQLFGRYAGANNARDKEGRPKGFGRKAPPEIEVFHWPVYRRLPDAPSIHPISFKRAESAKPSSAFRGSDVKAAIRLRK